VSSGFVMANPGLFIAVSSSPLSAFWSLLCAQPLHRALIR
jgi:hypothetical protein